jgi:hypothetical protein
MRQYLPYRWMLEKVWERIAGKLKGTGQFLVDA